MILDILVIDSAKEMHFCCQDLTSAECLHYAADPMDGARMAEDIKPDVVVIAESYGDPVLSWVDGIGPLRKWSKVVILASNRPEDFIVRQRAEREGVHYLIERTPTAIAETVEVAIDEWLLPVPLVPPAGPPPSPSSPPTGERLRNRR
jgi:hypothetical protein